MKVKIGKFMVDVVDRDCPQRECYMLGFDKGSFTPGVGYTSYHKDGDRPVCMTRHLHGCPQNSVCSVCRTVSREQPGERCPMSKVVDCVGQHGKVCGGLLVPTGDTTPREQYTSAIRAVIKRLRRIGYPSPPRRLTKEFHPTMGTLKGLLLGWQIYKRERKRLIALRDEFTRLEEQARADTGSYDEYHPGLAQAYEAAAEDVSDLLKPGPKAHDWKEWRA